MKLEAYVKKNADDGLLTWARESEAAHRFGVSLRDVEDAALRAGILPLRYLRNRNTIGIGQQLRLLRSRVAVIGCGGLGGHVIEALARLGVGSITAVDPDVFEESNLNRQVFSSINVLGRNKAEVAAERVAEIIRPSRACRLPQPGRRAAAMPSYRDMMSWSTPSTGFPYGSSWRCRAAGWDTPCARGNRRVVRAGNHADAGGGLTAKNLWRRKV